MQLKPKSLLQKLCRCIRPFWNSKCKEIHNDDSFLETHENSINEPQRISLQSKCSEAFQISEVQCTKYNPLEPVNLKINPVVFEKQNEQEDNPPVSSEDYAQIQQDCQAYLRAGRKNSKVKKEKKRKYSVEEFPEDTLLLIGTDHKLLVKISSVVLTASPSALQKQKESNQRKESKSGITSELDKYWSKRYLLFERFDEGIQLDEESWYSVTPEAVAEYVGSQLAACRIVLDGFSGAGGDSIKIAQIVSQVYSNDIDERKIKCLVNNASIYGVDNIEPIRGDFFDWTEKVDGIYLAPPWGGVDYHKRHSLAPQEFKPSLSEIIKHCASLSSNVVMLLPANTQIEGLCDCISRAYSGNKSVSSLSIDKIRFMGALKFICVKIGQLVSKSVDMHQELGFTYSMLSGTAYSSNITYFQHKKVVKEVREQFGFIHLMNMISRCQQSPLPTIKQFLAYSQTVVAPQRLQKLMDQDLKNYQRHILGQATSKRKTKKEKIMQQRARQQGGSKDDLRLELHAEQINQCGKNTERTETKTVSLSSSASGQVNLTNSIESNPPLENSGVQIQRIALHQTSAKCQ